MFWECKHRNAKSIFLGSDLGLFHLYFYFIFLPFTFPILETEDMFPQRYILPLYKPSLYP